MQTKKCMMKKKEREKNTISIYSQNVKSCLAKHSSLPVIQKHFPFNWIYVNFFSFLLSLKYSIHYAYNLVYRLSNGANWFAMHLFTFSFSPFTITLNIFIWAGFWSNLSLAPYTHSTCIHTYFFVTSALFTVYVFFLLFLQFVSSLMGIGWKENAWERNAST